MTHTWTAAGLTVALLLSSLVGCGEDFDECTELAAADLAPLPTEFSKAGLYANIQTGALAPRVWPFEPRFKLWTDGAKKQRWIHVPAGSAIDTTDMDNWRFPAGTKVFKEFSRDGVRVETRILQKTGTGDGDWVASAYIWRADQSEAVLAPSGGFDQLGTPHDVPTAGQCIGCHGGRKSRVLGFSAVQLAWQPPAGQVTVAELQAAGVLPESVPTSITLPGETLDQDALGYLHANCSHCHNATRPILEGPRCFDPMEDFDFTVPSSPPDTVAAMPAVASTSQSEVLTPGNANQSQMIRRLSQGDPRMPALGTEVIDEAGRTLLTNWVNQL